MMKRGSNVLPLERKHSTQVDCRAATRDEIELMSTEDVQRLVQDLQTHQIELEVQNDELREAHRQLGALRDSYLDLYNSAPVGYITFDQLGIIENANQMTARMLGTTTESLCRQRLSRFVDAGSLRTFYFHCSGVFANSEKRVAEISLQREDGTTLPVQLESVASGLAGALHCRTVIIDISERRKTEAHIRTWASRQAAIATLGQQALSGSSTSKLIDDVIMRIHETFDVDLCSVSGVVTDKKTVLFRFGTEAGLHETLFGGRLDANVFPFAYALENNRPIIVDDLEHETAYAVPDLFKHVGLKSAICVPIPDGRNAGGTLCVYSRTSERFSSEDLNFLQALATVVGVAAARAKADTEMRKLSTAVTQSMAGVVITDDVGIIEYANPTFTQQMERSFAELKGQDVSKLREGALTSERYERIRDEVRQGHTWEGELMSRTSTGNPYWELLTVSPIRDFDGRISHFLESSVDISREKADKQLQQTLIAELDHRIKNLLATVIAMSQQTMRNSESFENFKEAFARRILALGDVHSLLTKSNWEGVSLSDLASAATGPYAQQGRNQLSLQGDSLRLSNDIAQAFFLALHELAANAAKYGGLSLPTGALDVTWRVRDSEDVAGKELFLEWRESGLHELHQPKRRGFGSLLIERTICSQLGGKALMDFRESGLACTIIVPLTPDAGFTIADQRHDSETVH